MSTQEFAALLLFATAMSFTPSPNTTLSTALAANFGVRLLREWLSQGRGSRGSTA